MSRMTAPPSCNQLGPYIPRSHAGSVAMFAADARGGSISEQGECASLRRRADGSGLGHEAELVVNLIKHTIKVDAKDKRHENVFAGFRGWHRYSVLHHSHLAGRARVGYCGHISRTRVLDQVAATLLRRSSHFVFSSSARTPDGGEL